MVEDIAPDQAVVVTTVGFTAPAVKYAEAKGIGLAVLREVRPQDPQGRVQRIDFVLNIVTLQITETQWFGDPAQPGAADAAQRAGEHVSTFDAELVAPDGSRIALGALNSTPEIVGDAYEGEPGPRAREVHFNAPRILRVPGRVAHPVVGVRWTGALTHSPVEFSVGLGVGGLVAELALLTADGHVQLILTNHQIAEFRFSDDGSVIGPSSDSA